MLMRRYKTSEEDTLTFIGQALNFKLLKVQIAASCWSIT